jgi:hypothetical protein
MHPASAVASQTVIWRFHMYQSGYTLDGVANRPYGNNDRFKWGHYGFSQQYCHPGGLRGYPRHLDSQMQGSDWLKGKSDPCRCRMLLAWSIVLSEDWGTIRGVLFIRVDSVLEREHWSKSQQWVATVKDNVSSRCRTQ